MMSAAGRSSFARSAGIRRRVENHHEALSDAVDCARIGLATKSCGGPSANYEEKHATHGNGVKFDQGGTV